MQKRWQKVVVIVFLESKTGNMRFSFLCATIRKLVQVLKNFKKERSYIILAYLKHVEQRAVEQNALQLLSEQQTHAVSRVMTV